MEDIALPPPSPMGTERTYEDMLNEKAITKKPKKKKIRSIADLKAVAKKMKEGGV